MPKENKEDYKFKIWKRKDGIIMVKTWETEWNEKDAQRFVDELSKILETIEGKAKVLGDASGASFGPTLESRKIYAKLLKFPKIGKAAIIGLSTANKVVVSFLLKASGKKGLGVFSTKEEALKWLKEE